MRYREHPSRKHNGRADRYFTIRYKINGKSKEEGLGWASEGFNAQKASLIRSELQKNNKTGDGPASLAEKRRATKKKQLEKKKKAEIEAKNGMTFSQVFKKHYYPYAMDNITERSYLREESLFRLWLDPVIGHLPLKDITLIHLETVKANMRAAGRAPRSINYAIQVVRRVFNHSKYLDIYSGSSPTDKFKMLKTDNNRHRFLNHEEAKNLLAELKNRSTQLYEISLVSLRTGARANEIFSLKWGDVDIDRGTLTLWDTKNTKTRIAYMTADIKELLSSKTQRNKNDLIFPDRNGNKIVEISNAFNKAIDKLGFNEGVTDRRQRVVFHTLRHTYASWLVESGEDLYTVKELMGHSTIKMTERYSHLGENTLQNAVKSLEKYL